jgi:hypothetical protein
VQVSARMHLTIPSGSQAGSTLFYDGQLVIHPDPAKGPFADHGDSGSLVLSQDNHAVGILVGGGNPPPFYVATPIGSFLAGLKQASGLRHLEFVTYP